MMRFCERAFGGVSCTFYGISRKVYRIIVLCIILSNKYKLCSCIDYIYAVVDMLS